MKFTLFLSAAIFFLLALLADASHVNYFSLRNAHLRAKARTHSLARDLRLAFGGKLLPRSNYQSQQAIYCKAGGNSSTGTNATSATSATFATSATSTASASTSTRSPTVSASPWKLAESHQGANFFDGWSFFVGPDPTNGAVTYVNQTTGQENQLVEINSAGHAVMRVETTPNVASTRQSIRITTESHWNGGLFIMDAVHMPTGCGTWPAFWTNGPTWPMTGEIDIVEGVNNYTNNQATVHTNVGCTIESSNSSALSISGTVIGGTNCAAVETGNEGCGIRANTGNSFGAAFNANGGGVYAMRWDSTGVSVYFFTRSSIPADITAGAPNPSGWGTPQAMWPATTCNPFTYFQNHSAILDTTLCGDWAAGVWSGTGIPGQDQSCAAITGYSSCPAFIQANGAAFTEAYWELNSVNIYQLS